MWTVIRSRKGRSGNMKTQSLPRSERSIKRIMSLSVEATTLWLALISLLIIWLLLSIIECIDSDRDKDNSLLFNIRKRERKRCNVCKFVTFWNAPTMKRSCPCHLLPPVFLPTKKKKDRMGDINYYQRSGCDPSRYAFLSEIHILYTDSDIIFVKSWPIAWFDDALN